MASILSLGLVTLTLLEELDPKLRLSNERFDDISWLRLGWDLKESSKLRSCLFSARRLRSKIQINK